MDVTLPDSIKDQCQKFVSGFTEEYTENLSSKLTHNGEWKEVDETLMSIMEGILDVL